ncbi:MAG TPA: YihY family inner membrane protein [Burkholderiales bacterium]|nr:YihY family inner membrane protein [Burkholderiales bacterium]
MKRLLGRIGSFLYETGRRFIIDDSFKQAASLAYTTLLALVPLITIGLAVFSAFPAFQNFTVGINEFLSRAMLPSTVEQIVATHLDQFTRSAGRLTALGIVVLGITAILLMQTIDASLQRIFSVRRKRPLMLRILTYWGVLTLGPLLIGASLSMTSYLLTRPLIGGRYVDKLVLLDVVPFVLTALAFSSLYKIVPNRAVASRDALIGGLCAALLFEIMKRGFAFYIAKFPTYTLIYGAFAAIPIFLLWIYLSWLVVLWGAVLAATLPEWRARQLRQPDAEEVRMGERAQTLFAVLRALVDAQRTNAVISSADIAQRANVARQAAETMLEALARGGWIVRASGGERWVLNCDPGAVTVAQVYDRTLYGAEESDDDLVRRVRRAHRQTLDLPLSALAAAEEPLNSPG